MAKKPESTPPNAPSPADELLAEMEAVRAQLGEENRAFSEAIAESRKRHWNAASCKARIAQLNSAADRLGFARAHDVPAVTPVPMSLPALTNTKERSVQRMLELIAAGEARKVGGAWRGKFFGVNPPKPARKVGGLMMPLGR